MGRRRNFLYVGLVFYQHCNFKKQYLLSSFHEFVSCCYSLILLQQYTIVIVITLLTSIIPHATSLI